MVKNYVQQWGSFWWRSPAQSLNHVLHPQLNLMPIISGLLPCLLSPCSGFHFRGYNSKVSLSVAWNIIYQNSSRGRRDSGALLTLMKTQVATDVYSLAARVSLVNPFVFCSPLSPPPCFASFLLLHEWNVYLVMCTSSCSSYDRFHGLCPYLPPTLPPYLFKIATSLPGDLSVILHDLYTFSYGNHSY